MTFICPQECHIILTISIFLSASGPLTITVPFTFTTKKNLPPCFMWLSSIKVILFYLVFPSSIIVRKGFPGDSASKEPTCQCRAMGLIPESERFPWRRKWQPITVFLPGKFHGQEKPGGLQTTGSQRVRYNWAGIQSLIVRASFIPGYRGQSSLDSQWWQSLSHQCITSGFTW